MGLDVSHGCFTGSHSKFNQWRIQLAKAAKLPPLELMDGYWESPKKGGHRIGLPLTIRVVANTLTLANLETVRESLLDGLDFEPISWNCLRPSPLHELLYHSDCDGQIAWQQCDSIANCIDLISPKMPQKWALITETFITGLRLAASLREDIEFC